VLPGPVQLLISHPKMKNTLSDNARVYPPRFSICDFRFTKALALDLKFIIDTSFYSASAPQKFYRRHGSHRP